MAQIVEYAMANGEKYSSYEDDCDMCDVRRALHDSRRFVSVYDGYDVEVWLNKAHIISATFKDVED